MQNNLEIWPQEHRKNNSEATCFWSIFNLCSCIFSTQCMNCPFFIFRLNALLISSQAKVPPKCKDKQNLSLRWSCLYFVEINEKVLPDQDLVSAKSVLFYLINIERSNGKTWFSNYLGPGLGFSWQVTCRSFSRIPLKSHKEVQAQSFHWLAPVFSFQHFSYPIYIHQTRTTS